MHINTLNKSEPCTKEPPPSLKPVFEKFKLENADLNDKQQVELAELLDSFKDLWDDEKCEGSLTRTKVTEHVIEVDGGPIQSNPCRTTPVENYII